MYEGKLGRLLGPKLVESVRKEEVELMRNKHKRKWSSCGASDASRKFRRRFVGERRDTFHVEPSW